MSLLAFGLTFAVIGHVLIAMSVYFVHGRVMKEHKIDRHVLKEMKSERNFAITGLVFIIVGYIIQIVSLIS